MNRDNRKRYHLLAVLAVVCAVAISSHVSWASIRMDGSEFQGASVVSATTSLNKVVGSKTRLVAPTRIVATFGQPLMGVGTMTPETSNGVAFKLGLGYEYNVWKTSYDNACSCPCTADPVCDGSIDILDVITSIEVAYRGGLSLKSGGCPEADTDVDCNGLTDAVDVVRMIDVVFRGASAETMLCDPCKQ